MNTFGPAVRVGGGDIFLDRGPSSCIMHARTYATYTREDDTEPRARTPFEGNELRIGDTTESQVADLKRRTTERGDSLYEDLGRVRRSSLSAIVSPRRVFTLRTVDSREDCGTHSCMSVVN